MGQFVTAWAMVRNITSAAIGSGAARGEVDFTEGAAAIVEGEGLVSIVKKVGRRVRVQLEDGKTVWCRTNLLSSCS